MENFEKFILSDDYLYTRVSESVNNTSHLNDEEKRIFLEIFDKIEEYVAHNYSTANTKYIAENYNLSEKAASKILNSCLYYLK